VAIVIFKKLVFGMYVYEWNPAIETAIGVYLYPLEAGRPAWLKKNEIHPMGYTWHKKKNL